MAKRRRRAMDVDRADALLRDVAVSIREKRDALAADLERLDGILAAIAAPQETTRKAPAQRMTKGKRSSKRAKRGSAWPAVRDALASTGGRGTTASLKPTWAKLGNRTPLSVGLAAMVKSGRLKKRGSGRSAEYMLVKGAD